MFWQVCCASDPSVICTGVARGLAVKAVWLHSVVSVCFSKTASGGLPLLGLLLPGEWTVFQHSLVALAHNILGYLCLFTVSRLLKIL